LDSAFFASALSSIAVAIRKVSSVPLILGGSGYSLFPVQLLEKTCADFGVIGEGEIAFPLLIERVRTGGGYEDIPGLVYRGSDTRVRINPRSALIAGSIPRLKRQADLVAHYLNQSTMLNIQTQRGCSFTCCYCTYPFIEGSVFRLRDPDTVCDEIEDARAAGALYVFFVDSVFNTSEAHVRGICEAIVRRKISVKWGCYLRPQGISRELMDLMARAGLTHIEFGTDSLSDAVLDAYGKRFTVRDVIQSSMHAREAGVRYSHFLIIGGPGETEATIQESFDNYRHIKKSVFFSYIGMRVYPDTPLYAVAVREGAVSRERDLLEPYFYITPHVTYDRMNALLRAHASKVRNWFVGEMDPSLKNVMENLRRIGVAGPLWEFLIR
jgi:radical SAM superfamily enzyme YgiQ (UPF0313 family)